MKRCSSCESIKFRSEFYGDRSRVDGLQSYCKRCSDRKIIAYRKKKGGKESHLSACRKYNKSEKGKKCAQKRSFKANRVASRRAHAMVYYAVKTGKLVRAKECVQENLGGCSGRIVAHHFKGYAPEHYLDVIWLCIRHNILAGSSHVI